jgi:hypothetical protein
MFQTKGENLPEEERPLKALKQAALANSSLNVPCSPQVPVRTHKPLGFAHQRQFSHSFHLNPLMPQRLALLPIEREGRGVEAS